MDRSTILGNKNPVGTESERDLSIALHEIDMHDDRIGEGIIEAEMQRIAKLLLEGENVILMCWCAPKNCHCNSYKKRIEFIADHQSRTLIDILCP